jgi:hypothetical protein
MSAPSSPVVPGTHCATCGALRAGPFCASCGQPEVGRLTLRGIASRLATDALDLNRGLLFTFVEMWRRPGVVVRDYLAGRTVRYTNPLKYFLILAAVTTFVYVRSGVAAEAAAELATGLSEGGGRPLEAATVLEFLSSYFSLVLLAGLPTSALATRLVLRRAGFTYAEHLVLNTLAGAQLCVLLGGGMVIASLIEGAAGEAVGLALVSASVAYLGWTLKGLTGAGWLRSLGESAAATALATGLFIAAAFLAGVAAGVFVAVTGL